MTGADKEENRETVALGSELSDRLGPPPFAGETNKETLPDGSSYRSAYSFRVF